MPEAVALALPKPGDVVAGKYRIEKVVGEGGMGIVYAAHHLVLEQRVALKLLLVDALRGAETVERFVREAQAAARLNSEHVVRVTDAGALDSGLPFLVMEYLQGCDLSELLHLEGPIPAEDVVDFTLQALIALAQAHAAGIVHRDLKPANLFVSIREDGSNLVKVLDFGISKQQSSKAQWKELTGKSVLGTPAYMSPEQLRSSKSVDPRADLWSLGVVMYELLTGRTPFDGETPGEIFAAILEQTPAPLRSHCANLPQALEDVVSRCLSRDPAARFQDAAGLARALAPMGTGRWAHAVTTIDQGLARSSRITITTNSALVDAAVAAAITSLPPPMYALPKPQGRSATFVTDKTMFAEVLLVPSTGVRSAMRLTPGRIAAGLGLAIAAVVMVSAAAPRGARHAAASVSSGMSAAAAAGAAVKVAAPKELLAEAPPVPSSAASSADAMGGATTVDDHEPSAATAAATEVRVEPEAKVVIAASKTPSRKPAGSAKRPQESRPTFLKSWR